MNQQNIFESSGQMFTISLRASKSLLAIFEKHIRAIGEQWLDMNNGSASKPMGNNESSQESQ
jgi:hypothetical protein